MVHYISLHLHTTDSSSKQTKTVIFHVLSQQKKLIFFYYFITSVKYNALPQRNVELPTGIKFLLFTRLIEHCNHIRQQDRLQKVPACIVRPPLKTDPKIGTGNNQSFETVVSKARKESIFNKVTRPEDLSIKGHSKRSQDNTTKKLSICKDVGTLKISMKVLNKYTWSGSIFTYVTQVMYIS